MDGLDSRVKVDLASTNLNDLKFVEIKTCSDYTTESRLNRWRMETLRFKWWAQSYLTSVPNITVGRRTNDGIVYRIDTIPIDTLPNSSKVIVLNEFHWLSCLEMALLNQIVIDFLQRY